MSDRETRDLMSVDSFAQLPFIRPPPRPPASAIRLFGIEVPHHPDAAAAEEDAHDASKDNAGAGGGGESAGPGRKFVCHYCCRQFPTSQALGGHQNAHKRERQHAKRAHRLAAVAHQGPVTVVDGHHVYGLFDHHHQHHALGHTVAAAAASAYPSSWHASFYGGLGAAAPPGGGSALPPGSWRHHHHAAVLLPLTRGDQEYSRVEEFGGGGVIDLPAAAAAPPPPPSIPGSQFEFHLNIPSSVKENVSLDLHL